MYTYHMYTSPRLPVGVEKALGVIGGVLVDPEHVDHLLQQLRVAEVLLLLQRRREPVLLVNRKEELVEISIYVIVTPPYLPPTSINLHPPLHHTLPSILNTISPQPPNPPTPSIITPLTHPAIPRVREAGQKVDHPLLQF